jgi:hypothetical protein
MMRGPSFKSASPNGAHNQPRSELGSVLFVALRAFSATMVIAICLVMAALYLFGKY